MGTGDHHPKSPVKQPVTGAPQRAEAGDGARQGCLSRRVWLQLSGILALSYVLGFSFNAANPLGVRFGALSPTRGLGPIPVNATAGGMAAGSAAQVEAPTPITAIPPPEKKPVTDMPPKANSSAAPRIAQGPAGMDGTASVITVTAPPAQSPSMPSDPAPIHWPEVRPLVAQGRAVLVDVRHKGMYDAGHIPGSISLPELSSPAEINAFLETQPPNIIIVVYCSSSHCSQSARVAKRLAGEFQRPLVRYMSGGYEEYQRMERANPQPSSPAPSS